MRSNYWVPDDRTWYFCQISFFISQKKKMILFSIWSSFFEKKKKGVLFPFYVNWKINGCNINLQPQILNNNFGKKYYLYKNIFRSINFLLSYFFIMLIDLITWYMLLECILSIRWFKINRNNGTWNISGRGPSSRGNHMGNEPRTAKRKRMGKGCLLFLGWKKIG